MGDSSNPKTAAAEFSARIIRLDSNENPYGPSPNAIEAIRGALASFHTYPDNDCSELCRRLAAHHGMATDQILVGAGSSELISLLSFTMLGPGLNAVTSERSFIVYGMAVRAAGAQLIEVPMKEETVDLDAMLKAIDENTRVVFLANPNNPTGTKVEAQQLDKFLNEVPAHVVVALDEAYFEFAQFFAVERSTEYSRALDYVRQGKSVIVLRTFSKAHGLAGLRIGYGIGPSELLAYCARMQSTFSVSSVAQVAAIAALDDRIHIAHTVSENAEQARVISAGLMEFGYRVVPTWANFVYCDLGEDATTLTNRVLAEGVSVRPLAAWGAPNCIRVSIGIPEQNEAFLNAMHKLKTAG